MRTTLRLVALLLLTSARLALADPQQTLRVEPPDPTAQEPVTIVATIFDSCAPPPELMHWDRRYAIVFHPSGCGMAPTLVTYHVNLGVLAAGDYSVTSRSAPRFDPGPGLDIASASFTVLPVSNAVEPSLGSTKGGTVVELSDAGTSNDPVPSVFFGGVPATNVTRVANSHLRATTPPGNAGAVPVRIGPPGSQEPNFAFRYYDGAVPPSPLFTRVLIPTLYSGPGLNGTQWSTDVTVRNDNQYTVEFYGAPALLPSIPATSSKKLPPSADPSPSFLAVPTESLPRLHISTLVHETSRASSGWGYSIPVVPEANFASEVVIPDVPSAPGYRTLLRVYSLAPEDETAIIELYDMRSATRQAGRELLLKNSCNGDVACDRPAYGELANIADRLGADRVVLHVRARFPVWAFVTVTSDDTQQVTTLTP